MKADVTERTQIGGLRQGNSFWNLKKSRFNVGVLQFKRSEKPSGQNVGKPQQEIFIANDQKEWSEGPVLSSSLISIQPNGSKTPLFCIHAGQGNVIFYVNLSMHLGSEQPLYGLQAKGLDGMEMPSTEMREIANDYINEIRKVQPEGPYYLAGYCLGAQIAFEMAHQLTNEGQKIALLANFNGISPTYLNTFRAAKIVTPQKNIFVKTSSQLNHIAKLPFKEKVGYVSKKIVKKGVHKAKKPVYHLVKLFFNLKYQLNGLIFKTCILFKRKVPSKIANAFVDHSLFMLQLKYKPKLYLGSMVTFRSPGIFKDPYLGWENLIEDEIKTFEVPGAHQTRRDIMNEPYVGFLAKELKNFLD